MAVLQKVKINNEWVPVSGSNINTGGGASSSNTLIIHSDKDFEVIEDSSLAGVISDPNTTYNDIKNAIDNNYNIALKEPRGNLSYCLRADFVLEDQESGNKRIALFFTKSILTIRYDIILYIGLNNSILYMISKNDIFSKKEVEESIDNKATYVGGEAPTTDTVLWIDINDESGETSGGSNGGNGGASGGINVFIFPEEVGSADYTPDNPYVFSAEKSAELLAALKKRDTIYIMAFVKDASSPAEQTQSMVVNMIYLPQGNIFQSQTIMYMSGLLSIATIYLKVNSDGIISGYNESVIKQL